MANGPLSAGLMQGTNLLQVSQQQQIQRQQLAQQQQQRDFTNNIDSLKLFVELGLEDETQGILDKLNPVLGTDIQSSGIFPEPKAFLRDIATIEKKFENITPEQIPLLGQALGAFGRKYIGHKKFGERAEGVIEGGERSIEAITPEETGGVTNITEEIALSIFGKRFTELSQPERAQVLKQRQDRAVEVAKAKKEEVALGGAELLKFVNPETLTRFPAGTSLGDIRKAGGIPVDPKQLDALGALDNVGVIIDELDVISEQIITAEGAGQAALQAAKLHAGAISRVIPEASIYSDTKSRTTGVLSRSLGGEKGVLTDRDIERIVKSLPNFRDTAKIRNFKIGMFRLLMDTAVDAKRRVILGKPAGDSKKKVKALLNALSTTIEEEPEDSVDIDNMSDSDLDAAIAAEKARITGGQ